MPAPGRSPSAPSSPTHGRPAASGATGYSPVPPEAPRSTSRSYESAAACAASCSGHSSACSVFGASAAIWRRFWRGSAKRGAFHVSGSSLGWEPAGEDRGGMGVSGVPAQARVVVIGAGIVGNSMAYHLAQQGWKEIVLIDKGPLPNPGGSTGHASNFIFLTDHSKEMTLFTLDSVRQYKELGVFTQSGGVEVARTAERMDELKRRMASSKAWGIDGELVSPAEVKRLVPFINEKIILGGFSTPGIGTVDSLRGGTLMREKAEAMGALTVVASTEVTGIDVENGRVQRVRTGKGDIETETVVITSGIWSPRLARMAGASIPLSPAVHQMISVGPVPLFADTVGEIKYPIIRDMDTNGYERQHGGDLEVGSYDHRPILWEPDDIPSIGQSKLSPTELPFTKADFDESLEHALESWESTRRVRVSPFYEREKALGAVFFETAGWERPNWYASNKPLLEEYGERVMPRRYEWDARWWSPIINAEHLAMRDRVGMVDLSAFAVFDVAGSCALDYMQKMCVVQMNLPVGRVIYTSLLNTTGGIKADLTVMRLGTNHFRVVTGGADGMRDRKWFSDHLPEDGAVQITDLTSSWATIGVWGPRARDLLQSITDADVSNEGFPFGTCRFIDLGPVRALASRISYVGELGWEIHVPFEQGLRLWDAIWQAGQPHPIAAVGIGGYGTTGRLEKCYRAYGNELEQEFNLVETGLARPQVKPQDFIGKEAYLKQRAEPPAVTLCTLTIDDNTSRSGFKRFMMGREPVLSPQGKRLVDRHGRGSYVTSAGSGPSVGKTILMSFLPPEQAKAGAKLAVEYFGEQYPAPVPIVGPTPLFDPQNTRVRS